MTTCRTEQLRRALVNAGGNRREIEHALEYASGLRRTCAEYLAAHMPAQDLCELSSGYLQEHIDLVRGKLTRLSNQSKRDN